MLLVEYFADLWGTAFDHENVSRGARRMAFAQFMISVVIAFAVISAPFSLFLRLTGRDHKSLARKQLLDDVKAQASPTATPTELDHLADVEHAARRSAAWDIPPIPVNLCPRPTDGTCFETVRAFATAKQGEGLMLNSYEQDAVRLYGFMSDALGPKGLASFDAFEGRVPFKSWELKGALEKIDLMTMADAFDSAFVLYQKRFQLVLDYTGSGMPPDQAQTHPSLPSYDTLDATLQSLGGHDRFLHFVDRFYRDIYPWQDQAENLQ